MSDKGRICVPDDENAQVSAEKVVGTEEFAPTDMRPEDGTSVGILTSAQANILAAIERDITAARSEPEAAAFLARAAAVLKADLLAFVRRDAQWTRYGDQTTRPTVTGDALPGVVPLLTDTAPTASIDHDTWTVARGTAGDVAVALLIEGAWTLSPSGFAGLATALARSIAHRQNRDGTPPGQAASAVEDRRVARLHYRMLRHLDRAEGIQRVAQVALDYAAAAVQCRIGALALVSPPETSATIVATHGYPLALVDYVRIEPGVGIIGAVLESRRPVIEDGSSLTRRPRLRYRTASFAVVPLVSGVDAIGALCVTDRDDGRPFTPRDVSVLRVLAATMVIAIERERARESAELSAHAAAMDSVTGVFNRHYLQVRLEEELQRSKRHDIPIAVLVIDIDDFKVVNDSYGHLIGDVALKDIAEILRRSVRVFDVCARFGGDEFVIIMPGSTAGSAARIAERIRSRIEQYRPADRALARMRMTVSIGLAVSSRDMSVAQLLERADRALYVAKNGGKNQVRGDELG